MSKKKLARHVTVAGTTYGPGDDVPADVMEQIRNPKAWVSLDDAENAAAADNDRPAGTASGHKLATSVTVAGRTYSPRDFLPDEVAAQIRNPKAWEGGKVPGAAPAKAAKAADSGPDKESEEPAGGTDSVKATPAKAAQTAKRA